jgi:sorting and assembly machinery component 37
LRKPRATVSSLLQEKPENAAQIRLDALATSFYQPLHELRGGKKFFIGQTITSLDCLALGYLALCLYPDLPSPWLAKCMRNKFPRLAAFVHDLQSTIYGRVTLEDAGLTSVHDEAVLRARGKGMLPWKAPDNGGLAAVGAAFATNLVDSIPIVSQFRRENRIEKEMESEAENDEERQAVAELAAYKRRELFMNIGSVIAGVGLFIGFIFQQGLIAIGSAAEEVQLEEKGGLEQYGEAGAALAALAQQMDFEVNMQKAWENEGSGVEVDVEVVPDRVQ